jgi:hypothetical protein
MATLIDKNETNLLKEMEKLEKKQIDEAIKIMSQFQDKFKYHLIDLSFIEKISRWLNDIQVKIKTQVNASNTQSKRLIEMIADFDRRLDACERPNLDKISVKPSDLIDFFEEVNELVHERAAFLKCFKNADLVPMKFRVALQLSSLLTPNESVEDSQSQNLFENGQHQQSSSIIYQGNMAAASRASSNRNQPTPNEASEANSAEKENEIETIQHQQQSEHDQQSNKDTIVTTATTTTKQQQQQHQQQQQQQAAENPSTALKSNSKVISEDSALVIMKSILRNENREQEKIDSVTFQKSEASFNPEGKNSKASKDSVAAENKKSSKASKSMHKLSNK